MPDIRRDRRYRWWPSAHPVMTSFLGVPIAAGGEIVGAFYLVNKGGGGEFSQEDEDAIVLLAAHAAIAIQHAAAGERSRELSVVEERNRLGARAARLGEPDAVGRRPHGGGGHGAPRHRRPRALPSRWARVRRSACWALEQLGPGPGTAPGELVRSPPPRRRAPGSHRRFLRQGWPPTPRFASHRPPSRSFAQAPSARCCGSRRRRSRTPSATRAQRPSTSASPDHDGVLDLEVSDDGVGFDPAAPALRGRHLGLTSMDERAALLDGTLEVRSRPGAGTIVSLRMPARGARPRGGEEST